jgi:hypothetical protein
LTWREAPIENATFFLSNESNSRLSGTPLAAGTSQEPAPIARRFTPSVGHGAEQQAMTLSKLFNFGFHRLIYLLFKKNSVSRDALGVTMVSRAFWISARR